MDHFMKEFEHLIIQLREIKLATHNFDPTKVIGSGGFGKVYKGEVSHYKGRSFVAIKRLDRKHGQGDPEFWKEIMMLSRYSHENLISLLGFCDEQGEKILVYEYASNGSLDRHLSSTALTWSQRIKICLDAARGLCYLHDDNGLHQRILHRDIKSANILLDDKWNAKVADMGLSKVGPANQPHTALFTGVVGTIGYLDPIYLKLGVLTKESDVYSFGIVLFEVLCGKLCLQTVDGELSTLVDTWKKSYKKGRINEIIFKNVAQPIDPNALRTFSEVAFQCLHKNRGERPLMSRVVEKLEAALEIQEPRNIKLPKEYKEMIEALEELEKRLSKGVFLNVGQTVMIDFLAAEKKRLEEPAWQIGLEPLCAMINNNLLCYDLAMELASSTIEVLPENDAEQVNFEDTCKGFLEVAKEAVHQTVNVIYDDPGVQELLVMLYHKEWSEGQVTEYLVATFGDYFTDVKMYIEERSFREFVESCLEQTVIVYVDHLLSQKNYIKEETIERMRLDEAVLMDFFREYISVDKVDNRLRILIDLRELASAESLDTVTRVYTHILEHQPDCPPDVVKRIVGLREGIPRKDAKEVVQECKKIFENSLIDGNPPRPGFVFPKLKSLNTSKITNIWRKLHLRT